VKVASRAPGPQLGLVSFASTGPRRRALVLDVALATTLASA